MLAPTTRPADRRLPAFVAVALAAGLLAAMLPALATVPGRTSAPVGPLAAPAPAPAPAPALVTSADFPEQAQPETACAAILDRSSAIGNRRAEVAGSITTTLLEDACFGA